MYFVVLGLNYWIWSLDIQDSMFVELESGTLLFVYSQRRGLDLGSLQYLPFRLRRSLRQAGLIYRSWFTLQLCMDPTLCSGAGSASYF